MTRVKATKVGYHNRLFQPGDIFNFPLNKDKSNLGSWMEEVEKPKTPKVEKPKD